MGGGYRDYQPDTRNGCSRLPGRRDWGLDVETNLWEEGTVNRRKFFSLSAMCALLPFAPLPKPKPEDRWHQIMLRWDARGLVNAWDDDKPAEFRIVGDPSKPDIYSYRVKLAP